MPGFAHVVISLGLCVFLNRVTEGKFTAKHSVVVTLNSLFGPDLAGIFLPYTSAWYYFFHGSFGWFLMAIPVAYVWHLFMERVKWDGLRPSLVDFGEKNKPNLQYYQYWLLVAAGGFLHMFVDVIGHPTYINYAATGNPAEPWGVLWFGGQNFFGIYEIWGTGMFPCGNELGFWQSYVFMYGICGALIILGLLLYTHHGPRELMKFTAAILLIFMVPLTIAYAIPANYDVVGNNANWFGNLGPNPDPYMGSAFYLVGGEADFGVMVYFLGWFFLPLIFIYYSYKELPSKDNIKTFFKDLFDFKGYADAVKRKLNAFMGMVKGTGKSTTATKPETKKKEPAPVKETKVAKPEKAKAKPEDVKAKTEEKPPEKPAKTKPSKPTKANE